MPIVDFPPVFLPLNKLFSGEVSVRTYVMSAGETFKMDNDTCALVLAVELKHITLTDTDIAFYLDRSVQHMFRATVIAADANGFYDAFGSQPKEKHVWNLLFLPPASRIVVTGAVTATVSVTVMEWKAF